MSEREKISRTLPEDLVERIMARLPYPELFKARLLSKAWLARLSFSSREANRETKLLAVSFQNLMRQHCSKWKTFTPVLIHEKDLVCCDRASFQRRKVMPLSFLAGSRLHWFQNPYVSVIDIQGVLLLILKQQYMREDMFVVNVLTQSWKLLPAAPPTNQYGLGRKLVSDTDSYKVVMTQFGSGIPYITVYSSKSGAWSCKTIDIAACLTIREYFGKSWGKVLNGVLYWILGINKTIWGLLAFNVDEETSTAIQMPSLDIPSISARLLHRNAQLMVCSGSLVLLTYIVADANSDNHNNVIVMKICGYEHGWS